ncbi:MAG TPA: hypothetical protein VN324_06035 [Quisquiliibacterium sp.]|nr:hypothetical protein [Quisquiliibacterium sp.]
MSAVLHAVQPAPSLETLVDQWTAAKRDEEAANRHRVEIEAAIIERTGEPEEGSQTVELADGRKLTVTSKITRTIDEQLWKSVLHDVPEHLRPIVFVERAQLDLRGLRWLRENQPQMYALVSTAITAKRAKSAIVVKV